MTVSLHFHGAAGCVTGACFRLDNGKASILVDCGLFQGPKTLKELNYKAFPFIPADIRSVLLTHAHIDHSGQIPKLNRAGFHGSVFATEATVDLAAILLPDAGGIQESEVEQLNRRLLRRGGKRVQPIYTRADAEQCMSLFKPVPLTRWIDVAPGFRARWWNAGHILGSASIEVEARDAEGETVKICFSGDIGPGDRDFAPDPEGPVGVDHVVMESTYGATVRATVDRERRLKQLADIVTRAHAAGGPLLIPAFAVERTQELLADLLGLMDEGVVPECPIYLDSPLAVRATEVFIDHGADAEGFNPFGRLGRSKRLHPTESVEESRSLERIRGWHIIMAGSGMCDAGRIRHHLKRLLWQRSTTVLLCGFQAAGTLGRLLLDGARRVKIQGDDINVLANIRSLDIYSGHADAPALVRWATARRPISGSIFLIHGEPANIEGLRSRLVDAGFDDKMVRCPEIDDTVVLRHGTVEPAPETAPARIERGAASRLDWHNARASLLLDLDERLRSLPDDAARETLIRQLGAALTSRAA